MPTLVTRREACRFRVTYETLGEVARDRDLHPNRCRKMLREADVIPAFVSAEPHVSVYLRADLVGVPRP